MRRALRWLLAGAAVIMLLSALGLAAAWEPDRPVSELAPRWAPAPSQFVPLPGMQVHVRDVGPRDDPLPVVLIHGTGASLHTWEGWVAALQAEHRVISFDLPGFGLTGPAPDGNYGGPAYTRFVLTLLDRLGVQRCVVAGNSLGGQVAWRVAVAAPQRVQRLVLVDAAGYDFKSESVPVGLRLARLWGLRELAAHALPRSVVESSVRNVYGDPSRVTPALIDRYFEVTLREGNRRALAQRLDQLNNDDVADIRRLRLPTLIMWGRMDRLIPLGNAYRFAQDIPGSRLVVFDRLGHVPQEEDPAATVAVFRDFVAAAAGAPR